MTEKAIALLLASWLSAGPLLAAPAPPKDPDVLHGITQVDEGDYDGAILTLDNAARRLAKEPGQAGELSQAYLYLGIAYLGKGQEAAARARFRDAIGQIRDLSLSPEQFPPKVIDAFEAAREDASRQAAATAGPAAPAATTAPAGPAPKGKSHKGLVIGGVVVAAGAGVALAAGGGGDGGGAASPGASANQSLTFTGTVSYQESYTVVATKPGTLTARVQWQNGQLQVDLACQERDPPYTGCGGAYNRITNTSATYVATVTQKPYLITVGNYSGTPEPFTLTVEFP